MDEQVPLGIPLEHVPKEPIGPVCRQRRSRGGCDSGLSDVSHDARKGVPAGKDVIALADIEGGIPIPHLPQELLGPFQQGNHIHENVDIS